MVYIISTISIDWDFGETVYILSTIDLLEIVLSSRSSGKRFRENYEGLLRIT
jgi:hypothetical protein